MKQVLLFLLAGIGPLSFGQDIFEAVRSGDQEAVAAALRTGADLRALETVGPDQETLLMIASDQQDPKMATFLVAHGADVNQKTPLGGRTLIMYLSELGESYGESVLEILDLALKKGARINERDQSGQTALHHSLQGAWLDVTRRLLAAKADPNLADKTGVTPLILAVQKGNQEIAKVLLQSRADPSILWGETKDSQETALHLAVNDGNQEMAILLLQHGAPVNARATGLFAGQSPLHLAVARGDLEMVRILIHAQADPRQVDDTGQSPLDVAREGDQEEYGSILKALTP